jgi:hypothetical protein
LIGQNSNLEIDLRYFKLNCSGPADLAPSNYVSFVENRCPHDSLITLKTAFLLVRLKATPKQGFKARCAACTEHRTVATAFKAQGIIASGMEKRYIEIFRIASIQDGGMQSFAQTISGLFC